MSFSGTWCLRLQKEQEVIGTCLNISPPIPFFSSNTLRSSLVWETRQTCIFNWCLLTLLPLVWWSWVGTMMGRGLLWGKSSNIVKTGGALWEQTFSHLGRLQQEIQWFLKHVSKNQENLQVCVWGGDIITWHAAKKNPKHLTKYPTFIMLFLANRWGRKNG